MSMNESKLNKTTDLSYRNLNEHCYHGRYSRWMLAFLDVIGSKIYKQPPVKHKRKPPSYICKICFDSKIVELLILPSIIHDPVVLSHIPSNVNNFDVPTDFNNLDQTIHSIIFIIFILILIHLCPTLMLIDLP